MGLGTLELRLCHCMSSWTSWWLRLSQPRIGFAFTVISSLED
ncbi:hypothetical protein FM102_04250 [Corynebacterium glutamicum]|nr:hypothetical protein FM102_04250 [Corynebacterium glutamicum]